MSTKACFLEDDIYHPLSSTHAAMSVCAYTDAHLQNLPRAPAAARMYKKWPRILFLLSQPQYGTDTRENWTTSQHTQPLRSPVIFRHLVRHTHARMHMHSLIMSTRITNNLSVDPKILLTYRSIKIAWLTVNLLNSGKSKNKHI